eukprot:CAMPEP_0197682268 /NCGR_PEP_ID=MMETSP1338-20131121/96226_1 /TAXON_ID=43686 ORGANISM="Pelagodinium beii, Strain RCC1491" /NCGR_SAMPLE_ID=MMETSP1338 /ASSEMBLY_ACC=CAM_ASM_000754 /LENGTH=74 /DNA_ID=CAMNT_0043263711 /DNA_START=1 /DNA_END=225 /DNA_ORIENTATION=+
MHQLRMRSFLCDTAVLNDKELVSVSYCGQAVRYNDDRRAASALIQNTVQSVLHHVLTFSIQGRRGLIQQKHTRL